MCSVSPWIDENRTTVDFGIHILFQPLPCWFVKLGIITDRPVELAAIHFWNVLLSDIPDQDVICCGVLGGIPKNLDLFLRAQVKEALEPVPRGGKEARCIENENGI